MRFCIRLSAIFLCFLICITTVLAVGEDSAPDQVVIPVVGEDGQLDENDLSTPDNVVIPVVGEDGQLEYVSPDKLADYVNNVEIDEQTLDIEDDVPSQPIILYSAPFGSSGLNGGAYLDIPDTPPSNAPYNGEYYITGHDGRNEVIIYTPNADGWGVDNNGYLVRLGSSATGQLYLNGSIPNNSSFPSYGYPRYRTGTTGSVYSDLHIIPDSSNINIYSEFPLKSNSLGFTVPDYAIFFCVGLIVVILLTKRR